MIYDAFICLFACVVRIAALFSRKIRTMVRGELAAFDVLRGKIDPREEYLWFHAASLGEFEQGRPLIETIRERHPGSKVLLTFFSPSGYEVRKNYKGADVVCYLPIDTPRNVRRFVTLAHPKVAFFIKYEFWKNYLTYLHDLGIPAYSVSSIFRPGQVFFRWYGKYYNDVLRQFTHIFVQNVESVRLLASIGVTNVSITGDTRFDRVIDIRRQAKDLPLVALFKGDNRQTLVAGSSWQPDEDIFIPYFNSHPEMKLIIAPHVVSESHIEEILSKLQRPAVRYTKATRENVLNAGCLVIDCFGLLSSIYRYGEVAYIGGGFGVSIHNTLEAAVYGIPVIFGPENKKFMEAQGLKACGGGFEISCREDCDRLLTRFFMDEAFLRDSGKRAGSYVTGHSGAMEKILGIVGL